MTEGFSRLVRSRALAISYGDLKVSFCSTEQCYSGWTKRSTRVLHVFLQTLPWLRIRDGEMASARDRTSREKPSVTHEWSFSSFSHSRELLFGGHLSNLVPGFPFYSFAEVRERGRREEVDPENKVDISPERTLRAHLGSVFMEVGDPRGWDNPLRWGQGNPPVHII